MTGPLPGVYNQAPRQEPTVLTFKCQDRQATATKEVTVASKTTKTAFDLDAVPEHDKDRVASLIPSPHVAEAYTHRTFPGDVEDFELFDTAFADDMRHNVLMAGPSGAGKTMAARAYAAKNQLPFVSVEFNGALDPASTLGAMQVDPNSGLPVWKDGEITLAVRYGGVIMLDEVNFAPPRFTAAFHGVLDARQNLYVAELGTRVAKHPDTRVFSAYNPRYIGVNMLNEAFLNRWAFTIDPWGYDPVVEQERVGNYSQTLLDTVRKIRNEDNVTGDIGTNTMEEFIHISLKLNVTTATWLFLNKLPPEDHEIIGGILEAESANIADELGADL